VDEPWVWTVITILIVAGFILDRRSNKAASTALQFERERAQERIMTFQRFYLEVLRRELANIIMGHSLEEFAKAFLYMRNWEDEISRSAERKKAETGALISKFPDLNDFDLLGTRHFIRYDESIPLLGIDEFIERYKEVSKYLILNHTSPDSKLSPKLYDDEEVRIFRERMVTYKDHRLRTNLKEAMQRYYIWRKGLPDDATEKVYTDSDYEVFSLSGFAGRSFSPEVEYGVVCKKLAECGIYSFFADTNKTFHHYYR
jgi:hypothetical protein